MPIQKIRADSYIIRLQIYIFITKLYEIGEKIYVVYSLMKNIRSLESPQPGIISVFYVHDYALRDLHTVTIYYSILSIIYKLGYQLSYLVYIFVKLCA